MAPNLKTISVCKPVLPSLALFVVNLKLYQLIILLELLCVLVEMSCGVALTFLVQLT